MKNKEAEKYASKWVNKTKLPRKKKKYLKKITKQFVQDKIDAGVWGLTQDFLQHDLGTCTSYHKPIVQYTDIDSVHINYA